MKFDYKQSKSAWLFIALLVVIATANDVVAGIGGLYAFALTPHGVAVILVGLAIGMAYLLLRSFVVNR